MGFLLKAKFESRPIDRIINERNHNQKPNPRPVITDSAPDSLVKIVFNKEKNKAKSRADKLNKKLNFLFFVDKIIAAKYSGLANQIIKGINPPPKKLIHPRRKRKRLLEYASGSFFLSIKKAGWVKEIIKTIRLIAKVIFK